jgi:hypothetical protein
VFCLLKLYGGLNNWLPSPRVQLKPELLAESLHDGVLGQNIPGNPLDPLTPADLEQLLKKCRA